MIISLHVKILFSLTNIMTSINISNKFSRFSPQYEDWTRCPPVLEPVHCRPMKARGCSLHRTPAFLHSPLLLALGDCHLLVYPWPKWEFMNYKTE